MTIQIATISQNKILGESLKTLLGQIKGFRMMYAGNIRDFMTGLARFSPDIVLIDAAWGEEDYPAMIRRIKAFPGHIRVVVMAEAADLRYWKNQGESAADAVLPAGSGKREYEHTIRSVLNGHPGMDFRGTYPAENSSNYQFMDK